MTAENFAYWLQGYFELNNLVSDRNPLTIEQSNLIQKHLDLVFNKVTTGPELPKQEKVEEEIKKLDEKTVEEWLEKTRLKPQPRSFPPAQWPNDMDWTWRPEQGPKYCKDCDNDIIKKPLC
jgi:hypothetical protein